MILQFSTGKPENDTSWMNPDAVEAFAPQHEKPMSEREHMARSFGWKYRIERYFKNYLWIFVGAAALLLILTVTAVISYHNGYSAAREKVTEELTAEYRMKMQNYIDLQQAKSLVTGEASKSGAIQADAKLLARIGQGVMNTYPTADLDDARKVMICAICRVLSGGEFAGTKSIEAAVTAQNQWWGYSENLVYTEEIFEIAMEISGIYHNGEALPCSSDMVYAGWNGNEIVLRNQWTANANARYF